MIRTLIPTLAVLVASLSACSKGEHPEPAAQSGSIHDAAEKASPPPSHSTAPDNHAPHWSYEGTGGPSEWGDLAPDFENCAFGHHQSPINLVGATDEVLPQILFHYEPGIGRILNNGHTIQQSFDEQSCIVVGDDQYQLLQFHFHTPSEHQIDGKTYPLEMHLVHKSADGSLAVAGVMFDVGDAHPMLDLICAHMPTTAGMEETVEGLSIDPLVLLPSDTHYYTYSGSLTTPPCSEGVRWMVMTHPQSASVSQIRELHHAMGNNNRPLQNADESPVSVGK